MIHIDAYVHLAHYKDNYCKRYKPIKMSEKLSKQVILVITTGSINKKRQRLTEKTMQYYCGWKKPVQCLLNIK